MELRPYQQEQIEQLRNKFMRGKKRIILCSPTGSGKTVVFTSIIAGTLNKNLFNRVLVITDRIELFKQTFKALSRLDIQPDIYNANRKANEPVQGRCVVAMIETLKRRWKKYGELPLGKFDLIIIDEAHKGNFKKVFEIYPETRVIGATATPLATTKRDPLKNYYDDIVETVDIPKLIQLGYLVKEKAYTMKLIDTSKLEYNSSKGDYTEKSQTEVFSERKVFTGLIKNYRDKADGKKTIVFCSNIEMVERVYNEFIEAGYSDRVYMLHSGINNQRNEILNRYHSDASGIMISCGILTTGYDHPPIEVCILYRASRSLPLVLQMIGRCSRPYKNKEYLTVIDMGENIPTHGLWSSPRDWQSTFKNPPKVGLPQPPTVKHCPKCDAMLQSNVRECEYCGHVFPEPETKTQADGELVEVTDPTIFKGRRVSQLDVYQLNEAQKYYKWKLGFVLRVLRYHGDSWVFEFAKLRGYKKGWAYRNISGSFVFTDFVLK